MTLVVLSLKLFYKFEGYLNTKIFYLECLLFVLQVKLQKCLFFPIAELLEIIEFKLFVFKKHTRC